MCIRDRSRTYGLLWIRLLYWWLPSRPYLPSSLFSLSVAGYLRIVTWNTNGMSPRQSVIPTFIVENDINALLLCKTHLAHFSLFTYTCYQDWSLQPRYPFWGNGVSVPSHRPLPPPDSSVIEGYMVALVANGSEFYLVSMYLWPDCGCSRPRSGMFSSTIPSQQL